MFLRSELEAENKTSRKDNSYTVRQQSEKIQDLSLQIKDLEGINKSLKEDLNKSRALMPAKAQEKCQVCFLLFHAKFQHCVYSNVMSTQQK